MTDPIRIGGFFANFDTEGVLQQLREAKMQRVQRMEVNLRQAEARKAAMGTISSRFSSLEGAMSSLTGNTSVSGNKASVAGSAVTASAQPTASPATYEIDVHSLATSTKATGSAISAGVDSTALLNNANLSTDVSAGTFTINGTQVSVDPSVDSMDDVIARINSSGAGVTASLEDDANGRPNILRLTSGSDITLGSGGDTSNFLGATNLVASPGTTTRESTFGMARLETTANMADATWAGGPPAAGDQSFTINGVEIAYNTAEDSLDDVIKRINNSDAGVTASYDRVTDTVSLQQEETGSIEISMADNGTGDFLAKTGLLGATQDLGGNASYSVNGGPTQYASSNTINPAEGLSVTLQQETAAGSPETVTVERDVASASAAVSKFVNEFNKTLSTLNDLTHADGSEDGDSGILSGDSSVRMLASRMRSVLMGRMENVDSQFENLAEIGISFGEIGATVGTTNELQFDEAKFQEALEADPDGVQNMFSSAESLMEDMETVVDNQTGVTGVLAQREQAYDRIVKDIQEQQVEAEERINNELERMREKFSLMEQQQARAQSALQSLESMAQQLSANSG
ncbi:MAG: flagellar filament capping protein FliD [Dehalococcoidia bacterium]|nr:flagellar filament capping protein FliD [Dehalococcoidia bacterium]